MSDILERLRIGLASAQKRQAEVLKQFQAVQAEYNAVTQEVTGYQKVLENETRIEQQSNIVAVTNTFAEIKKLVNERAEPEINKTETIRTALSENRGMTPADVWKTVRERIHSRNYVYSVLKRLKDRKQVTERRGKYYLPATPKAEEGKDSQSAEQVQ